MEATILTDIILCHRFVSPPLWHSEEYAIARKHHGIVYAIKGHAIYTMQDGTVFPLREGEWLYMPRGSTYTTRCEEESFIHMTVNFDVLGEQPVFPGIQHRKAASPQTEQVFASLVSEWTKRHYDYTEKCLGCLYELIYCLRRELLSAPAGYTALLQPAREYLDEHFCEDFPIEKLAVRCGVSSTYFRRLFAQVYGESPAETRSRLRMARACDLLLSGQYSVEETALLCGYEDAAYFSRAFRKLKGVPPSRYGKE